MGREERLFWPGVARGSGCSRFHPRGAGSDYPDVLSDHYTTWHLFLSFFSFPCYVSTSCGNTLGHLIEHLIGFVALEF